MTIDATTSWLRLASQKSVVLRSLRYAVVVGAILTAINQGDALLRGDLTLERILRIALTVMVPYVVTTLASVDALRESARARAEVAGAPERHATSR
jgi:hypothetical protein